MISQNKAKKNYSISNGIMRVEKNCKQLVADFSIFNLNCIFFFFVWFNNDEMRD